MRCSFLAAGLLIFCTPGLANIIYQVTVDTSSLIGTEGSLDLQLNSGPLGSASASLTVFDVNGDGLFVGSPQISGDVSSNVLPNPVTMDNQGAFNDYFENLTFGTVLDFDLAFSGQALAPSDFDSGTTFAFSVFADPLGIVPALTTDLINGFAFVINLNPDGTIDVTNNSLETKVDLAAATATPEPPTFLLTFLTINAGLMAFARLSASCLRPSQTSSSLA